MRAILTYHSIDESGSPISMSEAVFRSQISWLAKGRVKVVSLETLMRMSPEANAVALTFDDGFVNFGDVAAPLLSEHGFPSTLFVVTDAAGRTNRWNGQPGRGVPELPLLNWESLRRLADHGVELGAHTRTHLDLKKASKAQLQDEIAGSAERIYLETGRTPTAFAYPYGSVSDAAVGLVATRFTWGCTTEMRSVAGNEARALLPRLDMYYLRDAGQLERWGTIRFHCHLTLRASARRVRRGLRSLTGAA